MNGAASLVTEQATPDRVRGMQASLHRDLGDAGKVVERGHVADREHLGMTGQREIGQHLDAAGAIGLGARGVGERVRRVGDACTPAAHTTVCVGDAVRAAVRRS